MTVLNYKLHKENFYINSKIVCTIILVYLLHIVPSNSVETNFIKTMMIVFSFFYIYGIVIPFISKIVGKLLSDKFLCLIFISIGYCFNKIIPQFFKILCDCSIQGVTNIPAKNFPASQNFLCDIYMVVFLIIFFFMFVPMLMCFLVSNNVFDDVIYSNTYKKHNGTLNKIKNVFMGEHPKIYIWVACFGLAYSTACLHDYIYELLKGQDVGALITRMDLQDHLSCPKYKGVILLGSHLAYTDDNYYVVNYNGNFSIEKNCSYA